MRGGEVGVRRDKENVRERKRKRDRKEELAKRREEDEGREGKKQARTHLWQSNLVDELKEDVDINRVAEVSNRILHISTSSAPRPSPTFLPFLRSKGNFSTHVINRPPTLLPP
jgi:hypothetical protein